MSNLVTTTFLCISFYSVDLYTCFFISGASKSAPAIMVPMIDPDVGCYMVGSGKAKCYNAGRADFEMSGQPDFALDHRLNRCNVVLPKPGINIPGISTAMRVSCSYRGGQCTACRLPGSSHCLNDAPIILLLTDEFGPAMVGSDNDCFPTIRIEGGSFEQ